MRLYKEWKNDQDSAHCFFSVRPIGVDNAEFRSKFDS